MRVFKSWLIANLEIVYFILLAITLACAFLVGGYSAEQMEVLIVSTVLFSLISAMSIKNGLAGLLAACIVSSFFFGEVLFKDGIINDLADFLSEHAVYVLVAAIIGVLIGIFIGIAAYIHFDDVVSRRFLYRNSRTSVFEHAWKYAFNRQFAGFWLCFGLSIQLLLVFKLNSFEILTH
ncbi:MAG: hypothetical protein ACOX5T_02415 [Candidatus Cryptobacteroides sp.]|jgi:hypothetical protein